MASYGPGPSSLLRVLARRRRGSRRVLDVGDFPHEGRQRVADLGASMAATEGGGSNAAD